MPKDSPEVVIQRMIDDGAAPEVIRSVAKSMADQQKADFLKKEAPAKPWSEQLGLSTSPTSLNDSPTKAYLKGLAVGTGEGLVDMAQGVASNVNVLGTVYDTAKRAVTGKPTTEPTVFVTKPDSFMGNYGAYAPLVAATGYGLATAPAAFVANAATGLASGGATKVGTQALLEQAGVSKERASSIGDLLGMVVSVPVGSKGSSFLPSVIKKKAGSAIGAVESLAGGQPVVSMAQQPLTAAEMKVVSSLDRTQDLTRTGGTSPKVVSDLRTRLNDPAQRALLFSEARDFYTNLASVSRAELSEMNQPMQSEIKNLKSALHNVMTASAASVGQGKEYADAMNKYAKASSVQDFLKNARPWLISLGLVGGGGAAFTPTGRTLAKTAANYVAGDDVP